MDGSRNKRNREMVGLSMGWGAYRGSPSEKSRRERELEVGIHESQTEDWDEVCDDYKVLESKG